MVRPRPPAVTGPEDFAARFAVSRETLDDLARYAALLRRWQKAHNLVAAGTLDTVWSRHFADSAQLVGLAPEARRWLDLGAGAGFPGMVVAILLKGREGACVDLVEATGRKCAFLEAVRRETGAPARIHQLRLAPAAGTRAHAALAGLDGPFDIVTARALAPLAALLGLSLPFFTAHTQGLFLKGQDVEVELTEAARYWNIDGELHPSLTDPAGRILMVHSLERR